jgi:hypothetical protein
MTFEVQGLGGSVVTALPFYGPAEAPCVDAGDTALCLRDRLGYGATASPGPAGDTWASVLMVLPAGCLGLR